ncbi:hypothetical protein J8J40_33810, partial [Mycobacterium tuberculosis]|nr:hypothetical protein [Mycobacterium tuberculosis]
LLTFVLKPAANGTWAYSQTSFPSLSVTAPGTRVEFNLAGLAAAGVFDPKLAAFTSYTATAKSATTRSEDASSKVSAETQ